MPQSSSVLLAKWGPLGATLLWLGGLIAIGAVIKPSGGGLFEGASLFLTALPPLALFYQGAFILRHPETAAELDVQVPSRYSYSDYDPHEASKFALYSFLTGFVYLGFIVFYVIE